MLAGLMPDERFGPTFVTELSWLGDGRLGVASCGERACRVRVLDPVTGRTARFDGTGPLLGARGDVAVALGACAGLPCTIETVDLRTGRHSSLVEGAGLATMTGDVLAFEATDGSLATLDLANGHRQTVAAADGLLPVRRTSSSVVAALPIAIRRIV